MPGSSPEQQTRSPSTLPGPAAALTPENQQPLQSRFRQKRMGQRAVVYFTLLAATGYAVLQGYIMQRPTLTDPALHGKQCFLRSSTRHYGFLPDPLNELLCYINVVFQSLTGSAAATQAASQFARWLLVGAGIVAYESFRYPDFWARRGLELLMVAQVAGGGVVLPVYFANLQAAGRRRPVQQARQIRPEQAWAVVIATVAGYGVPMYNIVKTSFNYDALSIWQIFPLYMIAATTLLPPILKPIVGSTSTSVPIYVFATLAVYVSASGHFEMLTSGISFWDITMALPQPAGITTDVHLFFLVDYLFCAVATLSHIILQFQSFSFDSKWSLVLSWFFASNVLGVGGGTALLWAYREIYNTLPYDAKAVEVSPTSSRATPSATEQQQKKKQ